MKKNLLLLCLGLCCYWGSTQAQVMFNVSNMNGCAPFLATFTNNSGAGSNYYQWDFRDGSPLVFTVNASHTFLSAGSFQVTLTGFDTTGHGMVMKGSSQVNIYVNGVSLSTSADTVCPGETLSAYVYSPGNGGGNGGSNYSWTFGDGGSSTQSNPTHSYAGAGIDTLKVTVTNNCGNVQHLKQVVYVKVGGHPDASFGSNSGGSSCPNDMVQFYPRNQNASSYSWTFGDGGTSTQVQPSYGYSTPGKWAVKLKVTSSCGTSSTWTDTIRVVTTIHFTSMANINTNTNNSQACPNDMINFNTNTQASSYVWKFSATDSTTGQNSNHSWPSAGTYLVTCRLHNGCNNDTTISTSIMIKNNLPFAGNVQTQFSPNPACPHDMITFQSSPASSYKWYFGTLAHDSSSQAQPTFAYPTLGTYSVVLKLYNGCGRDTVVTNVMTVDNSSFPMLSHNGNNNNWGATSSATCPGDSATFFAQANGTLHWNFGDGTTHLGGTPINGGNGTVYIVQHPYTAIGSYYVKLTVTNGCGNSTTDSVLYTVGNSTPVNGSLNLIGGSQNNNSQSAMTCEKLGFIGGGGSTYKWFFGNGDSVITHSTMIPYSYPTAGTFTITLKVINGCLNTASYTKVIVINGMNPNVTPTNLLCNAATNGKIIASATGGYPSYNYSLNGGTYQLSPTFNNLVAGTYTVTIRDSLGCKVALTSTLTQPTALSITPGEINSTCGNSNGSASVTMSGGTPSYTYSWSGGGNTSGISSKPAGSYQVTITDANGCMANTSIGINDVAGPTVTYPGSLAGVCISASSFALTGGSPAGGTYSGSGVSGGAFFNPAAAGPGTHTIQYTFSTATTPACTGSASNTIVVNALPHVTAGSNPANGEVCTGGSVTLTGGGATSYSWSGGANNAVAFTPAGTLTYTVTGTDANTCKSTATVAITVNAYPTVALSFTGTDTLGDCQANFILNQGTPAGGTYSGPGVVGNNFQPASAGDGTFTVTYSYTNAAGCMASHSAAIHVLPCPLVVLEQHLMNLHLYPNPSNGFITVETPDHKGTLQVMNATGQVIFSQEITQTFQLLNLQAQPNGMYLVKIESDKGIVVQRILISK
jgi:PKD repeat protein